MKKRYFKLKIKLVLLVVLIYLLGCGVLIYQEADRIRTEYTSMAYEHWGLANDLARNDAEEDADFIQQVYKEYYTEIWHGDGVGAYSMLKDKKTNKTLAEEQNFIIVDRMTEKGFTADCRIMLFGDELDEEHTVWHLFRDSFSKVEIIGKCDDTYIYLDELKYTNITGDESYHYIADSDEGRNIENCISFEEWTGSRCYDDQDATTPYYLATSLMHFPYGDIPESKELNQKAKEKCEKIYDDYINDRITMDDQSEEGLFTCYVARIGYIGDDYIMPCAYVFHPVSLAVEELSGFFFYATIFIIIIIAIICFIINDAYSKQLAYENNRRELTRGIAHELKTPLAVAKGYIENWDYLDEQDRLDSSKIMIGEIDHMNKMVSDLLELSHLEANKKQPIPESVDLHALMNTVLKRMKGTIEGRKLKVSDMTDRDKGQTDDFVVNADLEMIRTVLVNFISNAVKYADKEISMSLSDNGRKVRFSITNDGMIISEDKLDKVWDEFYRSDSINASRIGGNGLGLSISKQILMLHKAKYGCKNVNGKTEFWFEIKKV